MFYKFLISVGYLHPTLNLFLSSSCIWGKCKLGVEVQVQIQVQFEVQVQLQGKMEQIWHRFLKKDEILALFLK